MDRNELIEKAQDFLTTPVHGARAGTLATWMADFAQSCKMFAEKWNVTVILIAHNKKVKESATDFRLSTKDDIEGSKKITNWADTVLQMNRVPPQFREGIYLGADGVLGLCKSRESGIMGNIPIVVDLSSNRIAPTGQSLDQRAYGWDTRYD